MAEELIRLENVTKRFGGVTALNNVSLSVVKGEVHAVVGENGAGKSTLMKILAGVHSPDSGRVILRGQPVVIRDPLDARRRGISIVFQELNMFPHLTAAGNIFINRELSTKLGLLNEREMVQEAQAVFDLMQVEIPPLKKVSGLSIAERQLVEIARTLQQRSEIIIMDEPNSALTERETSRLFEIIQRLKQQNITIIYVSHRLEEVFQIADRISVVRDGQYQGTWEAADVSMAVIIAAMIGRRLEEAFPERRTVSNQALTLLDVRELTKGPRIGPISFTARSGEILGFAGLEGSGVEAIFNILFGLEKKTGGTITYRDQVMDITTTAEAIQRGLGLIPANRREQGLMMGWSIEKNITLVILNRLLNRLGLLNSKKSHQTTLDFIQKLNVATDSPNKEVGNLSGGNQQKVVVAKWLASGPKMLILNDPTRGVDVGAKYEIYRLCDALADQGLGLLFTSSEVEETLGLCDRILVLHKGKIVQEFGRGEASKAEITRWVSGGGLTEPSNQ